MVAFGGDFNDVFFMFYFENGAKKNPIWWDFASVPTARNGIPFYPGRGETAGSEHVNNMLDTSRDAMETVKTQTEEVVDGILLESLFVLELGC